MMKHTIESECDPEPRDEEGTLEGEETILPMRMPNIMPMIPPRMQITIGFCEELRTDGVLGGADGFADADLTRVRSVTETSMIFMSPIAAPRRVMSAMA